MGFYLTEIPHFLTNEECDYVVKLAEENGLISSITRGGLTTKKDLEVPKVESRWFNFSLQYVIIG